MLLANRMFFNSLFSKFLYIFFFFNNSEGSRHRFLVSALLYKPAALHPLSLSLIHCLKLTGFLTLHQLVKRDLSCISSLIPSLYHLCTICFSHITKSIFLNIIMMPIKVFKNIFCRGAD